jgi:hypothetical protein
MQKKRNLLKFLAYVAPDGHFIEMLGPFYSDGSHNDEWLHNQALSERKWHSNGRRCKVFPASHRKMEQRIKLSSGELLKGEVCPDEEEDKLLEELSEE